MTASSMLTDYHFTQKRPGKQVTNNLFSKSILRHKKTRIIKFWFGSFGN